MPNLSAAQPESGITVANASFSFTSSEAGSSFSCRIDGGSWGVCSSPKSYSGLAEGGHTFEVRATDGAGNTDSTPASRTFTVEVTEAPTIKPGKGRVKKGGKITLAGSTATATGARLADAGTTVTIERKQHGGTWRIVRRVASTDGHYRTKLVARRPGTHRYRASVASSSSSAVRVRVVS